MTYTYKTKGTCSRKITFDLEDGIVKNVNFEGGCNGNLKAISKLIDGMTVEQIKNKLQGNICGFKTTSCADQLAFAVTKAQSEQN